MLSCCPGEDTATEARFIWHSDSNTCQLWYAKASAPGEAVQATCESVNKPVAFRSSDVSYYKYTAALSSLDPGTEYIYYVKSGSTQSATQRFKTAGTSGSYNFLWLSDVHSHPDNPGKMTTVELLRQDAEARTASSGGIDMVLFSGDAVKYGSRYDNWQQWNGSPSVTNYTFAMVPGNKEYYYTGSSTFYDYYWYLAVKNNPPNGPGTTEQEGCYWFLRDSVLFVGIDSLIHKGSRMSRYNDKTSVLRDQTNWFDRVVAEQKSRRSFRYLVVVQHDPWFVYAATKDSFDKSRGNYDVWRHVFDKHKVDLALSGDEHNYIRTKPLRGDSANSDGTIYMVAGQIEESNYAATITKNISSYGNANATKYFDCMGATDASCGAAWIEVRPTSLKVTEFWDKHQSPDYKVYDSVTITPKDRGFEYNPSGGTTGGDATPHSRYRFAVDAPRSDTMCMQLSEIQLLDENGNRISSGYTIAYDSMTKDSWGDTYPSGEEPECAVDGSVDTKWLDWRAGLDQSAATRSAAWLDFCFDSPTTVYGYRWYTANDAPERTPASWPFSASDDGGATWTVLDKVVDYDTTTEYKTLAYSKRIVDLLPPTATHGKWVGGNGGNRFSVAANWDDGEVPGAGDALDFSSVTFATTIEADVSATFGAVTMGSGVVTFTGNLTASAYSNTSKIAVGANATVTLVGDLVFANKTDKAIEYIANAIAAGGAFVVTGDIVSSSNGKGYVVPTINGGDGLIVAKGLVQNSSCSDNPSFRLARDAAGTVRWVIGADGISGTKNYWILNNGGKPTAIIKPDDSNFAISAKIGNRQVATLRIDTTGRDGIGHTITLTGSIYREGKVYVEGTGTVVCAYVQSDSTNPFIVKDTATLALNAGSNIGTGGVTMQKGTTLALGAEGYQFRGAFSVSGGSGNVAVKVGDGTLTRGTHTVFTASSLSVTSEDFALANAIPRGCKATFSISGKSLSVSVEDVNYGFSISVR